MRAIVRACGALGVLTLLSSPPARAQGMPTIPPPGRREIPTLDFSKNGGWRVKARRVMQARGAMLARGQYAPMNIPGIGQVLDGDLRIPVVFMSYSDSTVTGATPVIGDTSVFDPVFFSATPQTDVPARPYSLKTFYEELSNGHLAVDGKMFGWIRTPLTFAQVGNNCAAILPPCTTTQLHNGLGAMFKAALDSLNTAGHQVDWGQFDNDGPDGVPNSGDDDGIVDFVTFIHPEIGGECFNPSSHVNNIWAHRWQLLGALGSMYTTKTPAHNGGFIRIDDYTVQSARGGNTGCTSSSILAIGTLAHETGHTFGIKDLYCTTPSCASEGVGEWSLMGSGNYTMSYSPASWDGWSKLLLGWVSVDSLKNGGTVSLGPIQTSDSVLIASMPGTNEFLLFENRAYLQSDTAQFNTSAGSHQKQPGLLIWHVDTGVVNTYAVDNEINSHNPEGFRLLQAGGLDQLHVGTNRGDKGDPYPGLTNNHALTYHSNPSSRANSGAESGFVVDSIYETSTTGPVVFRFRRSAPTRVTTNFRNLLALVTVNGVADSVYDDIFALGDSIHLSVADSQLVNSGRSWLLFQSWSDGQAKVHTVVSDGTPDTLTATLTAKHRINFVANGNGLVGTSGPATGTFVTAGTPVTLTATPNSGAAFTNWTGDTSTSAATVIFPMGRPYSVTANFTGAVAVTPTQATNAILGITPLTGPQATYLDAVGNNNAVYDLGDYLAFLKANGFVTAPQGFARTFAVHTLAPSKEQ